MSQISEAFKRIFEYLEVGELSKSKALLAQMEDEFGTNPTGLLLKGVIAFHEGNFNEARDSLLETCLQSPHFEAFLYLANTEYKLGNFASAKTTLDQGIAIFTVESLDSRLLKQTGELYYYLGSYVETISFLSKFVEVDSTDVNVWRLLGSTYSIMQHPKKALDAYFQAFKLERSNAYIHLDLSVVMRQLRQLKNAKKHLLMASKLKAELYDPSSLSMLSASLLEFSDFKKYSQDAINLLLEKNKVSEPFSFFFITDDPKIIRLANEKHSAKFEVGKTKNTKLRNIQTRKIRIGYVSADFKNHATTYLISGLMKNHDRTQFEIIGIDFSNTQKSSHRQEILSSFDEIIPLHDKSDDAASEIIRSREIDILIDLKGYTESCRPGIFSRRASPIQVNYLGYPGTMGNSNIDYIIGDRIVTPLSHQEFFSEHIVNLPCCYQPNNPIRPVDPKQPRAAHNLPDEKFIFCCFNHHWKWSEDIIKAWRIILQICPDSILWAMEPLTGSDLKDALRTLGIPSDRVVFASAVPINKHLERLTAADLFLDTFPCGAHTTASDAIFAGVPVLTILGKSFHSRVSSSLMIHSGLPEFVSSEIEEYIEKARGAYNDWDWTRSRREILLDRTRMTHPYNIDTTTRSIERAYLRMVDKDKPSPITVEPWWE